MNVAITALAVLGALFPQALIMWRCRWQAAGRSLLTGLLLALALNRDIFLILTIVGIP